MKTIIKADKYGCVTISYDNNIYGERITRTFYCPIDGGYVRETNNNKQVCEKLDNRGATLTADSRAGLIDVVRREYTAMRRTEKKTTHKA